MAFVVLPVAIVHPFIKWEGSKVCTYFINIYTYLVTCLPRYLGV